MPLARELTTAERQRETRWIQHISAVVALSLGITYGLGALSVYGQLKGAGLNAVQTMPLVPVEQILGRGMSDLTSTFAQVAILALLLGLVLALYANDGHTVRIKSLREWPQKILLIPGAIFFAMAIVLPLNEVGVLFLGLGAMVGAWIWVAKRTTAKGWNALLMIVGGGALTSLVVSTVASSLLAPPPLPRIRIARISEPPVSGELVTHTGTTWYVALPGNGVKAIPGGSVERSFITYPDRERERSILDIVLGRTPSDITGRELNH